MGEVPATHQQRARIWILAWVTGILTISTACVVGYGVKRMLSREDAEALETPLSMSIALQLTQGPGGLYGPFGGRNPWVLIHAPLYYRLAALAAWPLARAGVEPVSAALVAGRSLSILGLLATLAVAFRLAQLDGAAPAAAWCAVFLIAGSPVVGVQPYAVRPDMIGVALQTSGVLFVLMALRDKPRRGVTVLAAFAAFGLALCVKQHFVVGPTISTILLLTAWRRDRDAPRLVGGGLLVLALILVVVFGTEEVATGGRMSRAIWVAAANVSRVHPAGWYRASIVLLSAMVRSAGIILLFAAAGLSLIQSRPGLFRKAVAISGTCCLGLFFGLQADNYVYPSAMVLTIVAATLVVMPTVFIPVCALLERRSLGVGRLDAALWLYLVVEMLLVTVLCFASTGAWVNYAIQAVVFGGILSARTLVRAWESATSVGALAPIAVAVLTVPGVATIDVYTDTMKRQYTQLAKEQVFSNLQGSPQEFFFIDRPGDNRLNGRLDLVYDDWLYPVFESLHLAEPRSIWLLHRIAGGTVRYVVNTSDQDQIPGISEPLTTLGFARRIQVGPFFVWERDPVASAHYLYSRKP